MFSMNQLLLYISNGKTYNIVFRVRSFQSLTRKTMWNYVYKRASLTSFMSEITVQQERQTPVSCETRKEREERLEKLLGPRANYAAQTQENLVSEKTTKEVLQVYHSYTPSQEDLYNSCETVAEEEKSFVLLERIGSGGFGEVWKAQYYTGDIVAVKYCKDSLDKEILAASLDHDNITRILAHGQDETGHYIVREYVEGRNLKELLEEEDVSQDCKKVIAGSVIQAIQYLHNKGIVHGDIKPENILVPTDWENERVKVTDFGLARVVQKGCEQSIQTTTIQGSLRYLAPEIVYQNGKATKESDAYALGKVVLEMFTGEQHHYPSDRVLRNIVGPITREDRDFMTELELCLHPNLEKRTSIQTLAWGADDFILEDLLAKIEKCREKNFFEREGMKSREEKETLMKRVEEESYCGIKGLRRLLLETSIPLLGLISNADRTEKHIDQAIKKCKLDDEAQHNIPMLTLITATPLVVSDVAISISALETLTKGNEHAWLIPILLGAKGALLYASDAYKRLKFRQAYERMVNKCT